MTMDRVQTECAGQSAHAAAPGRELPASAWLPAVRQRRARETVEKVLTAAAELLAERGWDGFSMVDVGRRAQVSTGALYERVGDKDLLFLAVHERELVRIIRESSDRLRPSDDWGRLSTSDLVIGTISELAASYLREARLLRAFILRAAVDDRVRAEGSRLSQDTEDVAVRLLMTRAAEFPHPDPDRAARRAYRLARDSLSFQTAFGIDFAAPDESVSRSVLELGQACRAYLLTPPVPGDGAERSGG